MSLAAMVVVMTCKVAALGSTQDVCSYSEPNTWVYVTPAELKDCADIAQGKNEFYEYLRAKELNGGEYQTARCEVVNMETHDDRVHQAPEKPHRTTYSPSLQSIREAEQDWSF